MKRIANYNGQGKGGKGRKGSVKGGKIGTFFKGGGRPTLGND